MPGEGYVANRGGRGSQVGQTDDPKNFVARKVVHLLLFLVVEM